MRLQTINIILLLMVSSAILAGSMILPAKLYGDGNEYFLTMISLSNHHTADLRQDDVKEFYNGTTNIFGKNIDPYGPPLHYLGTNNKIYPLHFWAYSLINAPINLAFEYFGFDIKKTFQFANAVLFTMLLAVIVFLSGFSEKQKLVFMLLIFLSPAVWFLHWPHPEIFMFVFITLALMCLCQNKYTPAIIFASIASFQNQAILPCVLFLTAKAVIYSRYQIKDAIKYLALCAAAGIPTVFNLLVFGRANLLTDAISINQISILKIFEIFFDLNLGLIPYIPLILILFFAIIFWRTYINKKLVLELQLLIVLILMMSILAMHNNCNNDTFGPARYSIWMLPFVFFVIVSNIKSILKSDFLKYFLAFGLAIQCILMFSTTIDGVLALNNNLTSILHYRTHSYAAQIALNNIPELYNPTMEIFCERTSHSDGYCDNPSIYKHEGICKKAALTCEGLDKLASECGYISEKIKNKCSTNEKNTWFYVNY